MAKLNVILVSGSRHTIPPNKKSPGVPRIIETLSSNDSTSFKYKVISKYDDSLKQQDYNKSKFLHVAPTLSSHFFEMILHYVPLSIRKRVFGYVLPDRIVYYEGIKRLIRKEKPDIIITFMHFELFKKLHKAYPKAKHIYFFRSTDLKLRLGDENIDYLLKNSCGFLANTRSPVEELKLISPYLKFPIETIYNAINLDDFTCKISQEHSYKYRNGLNLTPQDFVIGYAGRLSEEKSILELLEAVNYLKNKGITVHLCIAGSIQNESTPNKSYYDNIIDFVQTHIAKQVHFMGWLSNDNLFEFYNAIDISVLLSKYSEGNSMFLLESLSMGVPVITTRIGGNIEMISNGQNGFLINTENIKENLIDQLELVLNDRTQLTAMSIKAIKFIKQNHTNDVMINKFNKFMKNFCEKTYNQ
ncbi:MAG: glycosyltransferase family 4 protein [Ferruginibacter sp.]